MRYEDLGVLAIGNVVVEGRAPAATLKLEREERVVGFVSVSAVMWEETRVLVYASCMTNTGRFVKVGDHTRAVAQKEAKVVEVKAPVSGGLKGFYGSFGHAVDAVGVIWGR